MTWLNLNTTLQDAIDKKLVPWPIENVVRKTDDFWVFKDGFPVTNGHLLYVPTDASIEKITAAFKGALTGGLLSDSVNIGINLGDAAGQTVMYPHVHFIPRNLGDVVNPVGGIRNVIPNKADYTTQPIVDYTTPIKNEYATQIFPDNISEGNKNDSK